MSACSLSTKSQVRKVSVRLLLCRGFALETTSFRSYFLPLFDDNPLHCELLFCFLFTFTVFQNLCLNFLTHDPSVDEFICACVWLHFTLFAFFSVLAKLSLNENVFWCVNGPSSSLLELLLFLWLHFRLPHLSPRAYPADFLSVFEAITPLSILLFSRVFFPLHANAVALHPECRRGFLHLPEILLHQSDSFSRVLGSHPWKNHLTPDITQKTVVLSGLLTLLKKKVRVFPQLKRTALHVTGLPISEG